MGFVGPRPGPFPYSAPKSSLTTVKNPRGIQKSKYSQDLLPNVLATRASRVGLMLVFKSDLTSLQACFQHPPGANGAPQHRGGPTTPHILTQQMLHDGLVVLPEVVEGAPARVAIGKGVGLDPAPASIAEKILTGIHCPVQRAEDGAGDGDAGF